MGYKFQFVTLAGFHALNHAMFELARDYRDRGMAAYSELQQAEFASESDGYTATRHQREVGTGYFDAVDAGGRRRQVVDHRARGLDRAGAVLRSRQRASVGSRTAAARSQVHAPRPAGAGPARQEARRVGPRRPMLRAQGRFVVGSAARGAGIATDRRRPADRPVTKISRPGPRSVPGRARLGVGPATSTSVPHAHPTRPAACSILFRDLRLRCRSRCHPACRHRADAEHQLGRIGLLEPDLPDCPRR